MTFVDVTQLKETAEQAQLLAAVLKDSADAIMVQDYEGRIRVWNIGAERMFGYTEAEAVRMHFEDLVPAELRSELRARLEALRRGGRIESWETRQITKDGRSIDVWASAAALKNAAGQPVAIAKIDRDITELKRARTQMERLVEERTAAQREKHERLQAILNAPDEAIITFDKSGTIESVNRAALHLFGYTQAEMVGQGVQSRRPPLGHGQWGQDGEGVGCADRAGDPYPARAYPVGHERSV